MIHTIKGFGIVNKAEVVFFSGIFLLFQWYNRCWRRTQPTLLAGSLPASHKGSPCSLFNSVQFSRSVLSNCLLPHESQHARSPCPSPTPGVHSNSCPSSQSCHLAISSSVVPFSSCPQSLPASGFLQWVNSSHEVAKALEFQLQNQSFKSTTRTGLL